MDVESLAKQLILQNMTPEQQKAVLESVRATLQEARGKQKQRVSENVGMVVDALKKIEADIRAKYDDLGNKITTRVNSIRDGRDGTNGSDGRDGLDGRPGRDGAQGPAGPAGRDGVNGMDGVDGVSVTDAKIDFDGSLIISLSNGREINVGEVVAPDVAEKIRIVANGGGTSQTVIDALASLQTQINNLIPSQTGNAGKFLTTNGSVVSWANVAGGLNYQGTWNASTNTPTLASSVGVNGYYYIVSTAGSTNLNGITDWQIGDWLLFNGTVWQKLDQTNLVISVNGQTGAVVLTTTDIAEGTNLYYTNTRARASVSAGTGISYNSSTGVVTNSSPDQTVALTGAGTTSITGTYPNFTITSNDQYVGTVTSVTGTLPVASSGGATPAISLASGYGDTQNPYASKTANFVLAAPNGTAGVPTFRAVVAADIPTLNQNTTGTASNVTGTVAIANGGTGQTTRQAAMDALAGSVTAGQYLRGDGTDVVMSSIQAADVPTLNQNTTGTASNVTGTVAIANGGTGQTTANNAFNALAPSQTGNSGKYLTTNGTNTSWATISSTGTVTSVAATVPAFLSITGSPITSSGTLAIGLSGTALPIANGGTAATSASAARTSLGLAIGTDVLAPTGSGASLTSLSATNISSGTLAAARLPAGSVLQVVQTVKTSTFSTASTSFVDITGLSVTITPTSASNKILVICNLQMMTIGTATTGCRLVRGSTAIFLGDAAGSRPQTSAFTNVQANYNMPGQSSMTFLDSPATTSATTYKVQMYEGQGNTAYVGRTVQDANSNDSGRAPCQITVMEIAG